MTTYAETQALPRARWQAAKEAGRDRSVVSVTAG